MGRSRAAAAVVGLVALGASAGHRPGRVAVSASVASSGCVRASLAHGTGRARIDVEAVSQTRSTNLLVELRSGRDVRIAAPSAASAPTVLRAGAAPVVMSALRGVLLWEDAPPQLVVTFLTDGAPPPSR
jgi:hypothetical protein